LEWWPDTVVAGRVDSELTCQNYDQIVRLPINPTIGQTPCST
jgi:hypothetical protein